MHNLENVELLVIDANNRDNAESQALLQEYYVMRAKAFEQQLGMKLYTNEPTLNDLAADAVFVIARAEGKVVGGCHVNFSTPENRKRLKFEGTCAAAQIENMLPHIDTSTLRYAEMGGVAVDSDWIGVGLGTKLQKHTFRMVQAFEPQADVLVGRIVPKNLRIILSGAQRNHVPIVVRDDIEININGLPRTLVMYAIKPEFPLLSEEMRNAGIGTPGNEFLLREKPKRIGDEVGAKNAI